MAALIFWKQQFSGQFVDTHCTRLCSTDLVQKFKWEQKKNLITGKSECNPRAKPLHYPYRKEVLSDAPLAMLRGQPMSEKSESAQSSWEKETRKLAPRLCIQQGSVL